MGRAGKAGGLGVAVLALGAALGGAAFVGGCETIPYAERVAAYEAQMQARFVGQSADTLVIALGPPDRSYALSDGREVFQYSREQTITGGGDSYTTTETSTRVREIRESDGTVRQVEERISVPVTRVNPVYTRNLACTRRFVIDQNDTVQSFAWEGNSCF
jgi:hypothetical protein